MATSKTLTPTNVTISIPEFTDQPDQRVNSNCIDKEADAINKINTEATNTNIGSFATLAGLATLLDTMLGNMQSAGVKSFQTNATATVDPFVSGLTYMGTIYKSGSNTTFTYVEMRPISENKMIIGRRQSGGGYTWAELAINTTQKFYMSSSGTKTVTLQSDGIYQLTIIRLNTTNSNTIGLYIIAAHSSNSCVKAISASSVATVSVSSTTLTVTTSDNYVEMSLEKLY